jgi:hypothetical protein
MPAVFPPPPVHLLIPYAAASADACQAALKDLDLPHLSRLLGQLKAGPLDAGDDYTLTPPHERTLAHALGLPFEQDGQLPWAAWEARQTDRPCAWFTPCHWQVGMEHIALQPIDASQLNEADAMALLQALAPLAAEDGITLTLETPTRWRAEGEPLRDLACASLDRVAWRRADGWLLSSHSNPHTATLLRLQNEAQMLFYTHRVTDERAVRGLPAVNGFWISGAGVWQGQRNLAPAPEVPDTLRQAALRGDWRQWADAWRELDAGPVAALLQPASKLQPVQLTLCGERHAQTWTTPNQSPSLWSRARAALGLKAAGPTPTSVLAAL